MRLTILTLALAAAMAVPAASASEETDLDRFMLWFGCQPVRLSVEHLDKEAADIGLTQEAITVAVRSRLRAARLYDETDFPFTFLYVSVDVARQAFVINVFYNKWLQDQVSGEGGIATTWRSGTIGMHGNDSGYILSHLSRHIDHFIDEYLRVNSDSCR